MSNSTDRDDLIQMQIKKIQTQVKKPKELVMNEIATPGVDTYLSNKK